MKAQRHSVHFCGSEYRECKFWSNVCTVSHLNIFLISVTPDMFILGTLK